MTQEMYHFIGIGGIGMSGLARILLERGSQVTGSDIASSYVTQALEKQGAKIHVGHDAKHVTPYSTVIISSDIPTTNPEIEAAKNQQCRLLHRSDLLLELMQKQKIVAIAGTHGKTSTTSLLIHAMKVAKFDPAFAVGGMMHGHETNAQDGKGEYFIAEADESDGTFLKYNYHSAIVTNIDTDHLVHYGSWDKLVEAFTEFMKKSADKDRLFYCADDKTLSQLHIPGISYGFSEKADLRLSNFQQKGFSISFDAHFKGKSYLNIVVNMTGEHNALNALAVFGLCIQLGVPEFAIREAFSTFNGVKRRMDKKGEIQSILLYDDYAHHPTEIKVTLKAARNAVCEKRLIAVFQPHRYSRMQYSMLELDNVFQDADLVVVTDLFTANEKPIPGVTTERIIEEIKNGNQKEVVYIPRSELISGLQLILRPHDVLITLGAGDITKVGTDLVIYLQKNPIKKMVVGLLFGGMNCEHEVSCVSAKNIANHLSRDLYAIKAIQIGLDGCFRRCDENLEPQDKTDQVISPELFSELLACDLFVPVLHGPFGEDGVIQGFLDVLRKPYVGCDVRSAALCMDKAHMKSVAQACGVATAPFISFDCVSFQEKKEEYLKQIQEKFLLPVFVKPSHLGSSIGIAKVENWGQLQKMLEQAFLYDTHVLVEQVLKAREIEFAVLGNFRVQVPPPGEILANGKVYSYEAKYGEGGFATATTAILSKEKIEEGCKLAEEVFRAAGCQGLARVDFFLEENSESGEAKFWFNEINPMPGFTPISLYPKIWEKLGSIEALIDTFVILAMQRSRIQEAIFSYSCKNLARR